MKIIYLSLVLICLVITSCKKDVSNDSCKNADFIGEWVGTENCDSAGETPVEILFREGSGGKLEVDGGQFHFDQVDLTSCKLSGGSSFTGLIVTISGELSNQKLTLKHESNVGIAIIKCEYNLTKK